MLGRFTNGRFTNGTFTKAVSPTADSPTGTFTNRHIHQAAVSPKNRSGDCSCIKKKERHHSSLCVLSTSHASPGFEPATLPNLTASSVFLPLSHHCWTRESPIYIERAKSTILFVMGMSLGRVQRACHTPKRSTCPIYYYKCFINLYYHSFWVYWCFSYSNIAMCSVRGSDRCSGR